MAQKSLATLMKAAQQQLDILAKESSDVQARIDEHRTQLVTIEAKVEIEKEHAASLNMIALMPTFMARARAESEAIERAIVEAETTLKNVQDRLKTAYSEKSQYESLIEKREARLAEKTAKAEQSELDEVAAMRRAG